MSEEKTPAALLVSRLILCAVLILACFALGMFLGEQITGLSDRYDFLRKGVPALGLGLLLGIARNSLLTLNNVMDFARSGKGQELWKPVVVYVLTGVTLALALHLLETQVEEEPAGKIVVWNGLRGVPAPSAEPDTGDSYAVFPVFFPQEAGGYDRASGTFATGTGLGPSEERLVRSLVRGLLGCARDPASGVGISVRGFASSSTYGGAASTEVDALNLQVAQARADAVARAIAAERAGAPGLKVEVKTWESVAEMAAAQTFNDSVGEYSTDLGFLNRRAEIHLEDPGACEVVGAGD